MAKPKKTYCDTRLEATFISPEQNTVTLVVNGKKKKYTMFSATDKDDIDIKYLNLYGEEEQAPKPGNKWPVKYWRHRVNPSREAELGKKYNQGAGTGIHIYLTPTVIKKYQSKEQIKTLYMVEGEFKAYAAYLHGINIIGLPSITAYKEKDSDTLHPTIIKILRECNVEELVMIYDADLHEVNWEKWQRDENYDLGKRANSFFSSAKNIRELSKSFVKDVYLCHISSRFLAMKQKGLDDLYAANTELDNQYLKVSTYDKKVPKITAALVNLRGGQDYFNFFNLSTETPAKLREFFRMGKNKAGAPEQFFNFHRSKLEDKEFIYNQFRYKYDKVDDVLTVVKHPDSDLFIRVACDYIKIITIPEVIRGIKVCRRKLEPWKSGEISRDYVRKGYKNFFDSIRKFDQFTSYPDNTESYKQIIDNTYNLYYQVQHEPEPGEWPTIQMFLSHLFAEQIDLIHDYFTLLYRTPWQILPIIALVSEERGTGKTKFLELMREIFNENATILGNDAITDNYNDDYVSKLIIGIDEGLIEKKATVEKIKSWSTSTRIKMSTKFLSRQEIPFYGKIVITSNNTDSFIQIDDEETRFWIRKIPKITKEDPDLMDKMTEEIPAFLYFLKERALIYPKETRHWFANHLLKTDALKEIVENSQSWLQKELTTLIEDEFFKYNYHELSYTVTEVSEILNNRNAGAKFRSAEIKRYLEKKFKLQSQLSRVKFPVYDIEAKTHILNEKAPGRYYTFYIENFLSNTDLAEIGYDREHLVKIHLGSKGTELWPHKTITPKQESGTLSLPLEGGIFTDDGQGLPY